MTNEALKIKAELTRAAVSGELSRREVVRRGLRAGLGLAAVAALVLTPRGGGEVEAARTTSIPPNCIKVCCFPDCWGWIMCDKCYDWPKATTTTTTFASR